MSVVLSMTFTLTMLHRFNRSVTTQEVPLESPELSQPKPVLSDSVVPGRATSGIQRYGEIRFSKPAAHTFAIDRQNDIAGFEKLLQTEGRIIE